MQTHGGSILGSGNSKCKGPEARMYLSDEELQELQSGSENGGKDRRGGRMGGVEG